jgi:8-hydroxy-5-deazaflavin:NADPH oxidoreductase
MNIGILGGGKVGGTLGKAWAAQGHHVMFGTRDPSGEKTQILIREAGLNASAGRIAEAAQFGEVILLSIPWTAVQETLQAAGNLAGKIVIDATNAMQPPLPERSGAEDIAAWAPGARVVKAFNTTGFDNMAQPRYGGMVVDIYYCGDDAEAKARVSELIRAIGAEPVDVGPLANARLLEALAQLWIFLAYRQGMGRNIAFKLLQR